MSILLFLLTPKAKVADNLKIFSKPRLASQDFSQAIHLVAFTLMPNHYHLVIHAKESSLVPGFMQRLNQKFTHLINTNHNFVGHLFQSQYKSRLINSELDLVNTTAYVHLNSNELMRTNTEYYKEYPYNSLATTHPVSAVVDQSLLFTKSGFSREDYNKYLDIKSKNFLEMQFMKKLMSS
ncbi:transposase [Candidatus Saccharibacteria bacterium]|nr:transposase [Candidatus Saccharibacteria bacterium]MCB9834924.1 transposase [Candidatus Nomurabacteria bacterium]